jgi:subtilisin family serine protease
MLNVFPKKSLCLVILFASTALTACGGGGGVNSSSFTVTTDTKSGTLPQIRPFVPDPTVPDFDASATEYVDTPTLRSMGLTPFYATGLSGSGISVGVLDSGIDGNHEELDGRASGGGDWQGNGQGIIDPFGHGTHVASIIAAARNQRGIHGVAPYAGLVSYRILNTDGKFGSQNWNFIVRYQLNNAKR